MKKIIFLTTIALIITLFISFWLIISGGYDKQNKSILFLKKIIPSSIARNVRDTIFFIPTLQERNKFLELQLQKYEQGLKGSLFYDEKIQKKNLNYQVKKFFLPYPSLDLSLGWQAEKNSTRAHYLEIIGDKVLVISGEGETIYFEKQNINKNFLNQKYLNNNLQDVIKKRNNTLSGIRDLFYEEDFIYISVVEIGQKGGTLNVYRAKKDFEFLNFEIFFESKEFYEKGYTLQSGGRIESFKNNEILLSVGFFNKHEFAQDEKSLLGKIISINKENKNFTVQSKGHRNPQGLYYWKEKNIIINSEHGPKGGDEVNLNYLNKNIEKNFGWPISSYGEAYTSKQKEFFDNRGYLKKSHSDFGFIEPLKYFNPSIGISEIVQLNDSIYVSSLRAESIYVIKLSDKEIVERISRLKFDNRIRDLKYDEDSKSFFLIFENTPAVGFIKLLN